MDRIDRRVLQQRAVVGVTRLDLVTLTAFIKPLAVAAANRGDFRSGIVLVDRDELGPEPQADDRHADWLVAGHARNPLNLTDGRTCTVPCRIVGPGEEGKNPGRR